MTKLAGLRAHTMLFSDLGLSDDLLRAIREQGYTQPTPVQSKAIPVVLDGKDVLAGAQTGTGKTAGFTLPLLQRLCETMAEPQHNDHADQEYSKKSSKNKKGRNQTRPIRALILTPTRELASQVSDSVRDYGKYLPLRSQVVFGGVKIGSQIFKLKRGADVLVATPGRLLDLINQRVINLSKVELLVLDEADRMLDMGFLPSIEKILSLIPESRQSLLFSATYSSKIAQLAKNLLNNPVHIEVAQRNTVADNITHVVHPVQKERKRELLSYLIGTNNWQQVLVFAKTKHGTDRLAKQLRQDGLRAAAIHGDMSQAARKKSLQLFKDNKVQVLVATDVAARGLDIHQLSHVVNFELPYVAEDYIHRIGRTGRAGNDGVAISLLSADEKSLLRSIEQLLKRSVKKSIIEGFEPDFSLKFSPADNPQKRRRKPRSGSKSSNRSNAGNYSKSGNRSNSGKQSSSGNKSNSGNKSKSGNRSNAGYGDNSNRDSKSDKWGKSGNSSKPSKRRSNSNSRSEDSGNRSHSKKQRSGNTDSKFGNKSQGKAYKGKKPSGNSAGKPAKRKSHGGGGNSSNGNVKARSPRVRARQK